MAKSDSVNFVQYHLAALMPGNDEFTIGMKCDTEAEAQFRATDYHIICKDNGFKIDSCYLRIVGNRVDVHSYDSTRVVSDALVTLFQNPSAVSGIEWKFSDVE